MDTQELTRYICQQLSADMLDAIGPLLLEIERTHTNNAAQISELERKLTEKTEYAKRGWNRKMDADPQKDRQIAHLRAEVDRIRDSRAKERDERSLIEIAFERFRQEPVPARWSDVLDESVGALFVLMFSAPHMFGASKELWDSTYGALHALLQCFLKEAEKRVSIGSDTFGHFALLAADASTDMKTPAWMVRCSRSPAVLNA